MLPSEKSVPLSVPVWLRSEPESELEPEVAGKLRTNMLIIAALIEGVAMFAVIICFMAVI